MRPAEKRREDAMPHNIEPDMSGALRRRRARVNAALLLSAVIPSALGLIIAAPAGGADVAFPPDLQRVIDENTRSIAQLRSVNAIATISETFEARGRRASFQDNVAIWIKGRKV